MSGRTAARARTLIALLGLALVAALAVPVAAQAAPKSNELVTKHVLRAFNHPDNGPGTVKPAPAGHGGRVTSNGINYHGGPVMLGTTNVYYIWYGTWGTDSAQTLLPKYPQSVGGSPYFNINTSYYNGANQHVTNAVAYKGATVVPAPLNTKINDNDVQTIVANAIASGALGPADTNGVYFVLTSGDIDETSGFLTQYCGWHTNGTIAGKDIKYSFVGDPTRNLAACSIQSSSPNGNVGADAMVSIVAHELEESVTDPDLNAWWDSRGNENADKCAWTFGTTKTASNGSKYNITLGGTNFLIQRNWVNASGGFCSMSY